MRFLVLVLVAAVQMPVWGWAQDTANRELRVNGHGIVAATPDMAVVDLGVVTQSKTARKALAQNSTQMTSVFESLTQAGIDPSDVQTSGLSLNPQWSRNSNDNSPPQTIGYQARNSVSVRIRDMAALGGVLDQLSQAGANRISHIRFAMQHPRPLKDQARKNAVKDALAKAELYAASAGVTLGQILIISEGAARTGPAPMMRGAEAAMSNVPVAEGELQITADVVIVIEIQ